MNDLDPIGEHRRGDRLRGTAVLPAAFTLLNGLCGFAAIHYAVKQPLGVSLTGDQVLMNLQIAAGLLFAAMFCDMLDGRVARMTRTTSDFGAQLDSLCDVISFGVAPAVLMLRSCISVLREQDLEILGLERVVWGIAAVYMLSAVLRLARFNVETEEDESAHMSFKGLPTPGAAACIASLVLLLGHLSRQEWLGWDPMTMLRVMSFVLPIMGLATGLLMVSQCPYPHIVNHYIRGHRPFSYIYKLVLLLVVLVISPFPAMAVLSLIYVFSGPLHGMFKKKTPEDDAPAETTEA
jgi:CDP-diacylglycerol--serine O-phosphatidyltransferase